MAFISFFQKYHFLTNRLAWIFLRSTQPRSQNTVISVGGASVFYQRSPDPLVLLNLHIFPVGFIVKGFIIRDLSEISRRGGEIRWPIPSMGVKFANPPLKLGLKYPFLFLLPFSSASEPLHTLGARDFWEDLSAFGQHRKFPPHARKTSGTQGNLYMITGLYLHDPPPFKRPIFRDPSLFWVSKSCDPPSVSAPPPPC